MQPFKFNWSGFNAGSGIKYVIGIILVILLASLFKFPWWVGGFSALFAWLTDLPGKRRDRMTGIAVYLVGGAFLTYLFTLLAHNYWPWLSAMFVIAFLGALAMCRGARAGMVGWTLTYWFLCIPVMGSPDEPARLVLSHLLGSGSVLLLVLLGGLWKGRKQAEASEDTEESPPPSLGIKLIALYALIVASTIAVGMMIGHKWLKSDPTLVASAAFMVIGFGVKGTWLAGLERMIAGLAGILCGFYLGLALPGEMIGLVVTVITSFFVLAMMNVNNGAVVFFFLFMFAFGWGSLGYEKGNFIANERIIAEFVGIALAGFAVVLLSLLDRVTLKAEGERTS
jgi:hypothetical protein